MQERVRVRRDRPSALSWAFALAVTMLAVWLVTLRPLRPAAQPAAAAQERVTREVTLEGVEMYFAALGAYPDAGQARVDAAMLTQRGAAGVIWTEKESCCLLGAGYPLEADARRIVRRLEEQEGLQAQVLELSVPAVRLRVTAAEDDIGAITAADEALRACLNRLSELALQVDRGETGDASARMLAAVARSELEQAGRTLSSVEGASEEPLCAGLIGQIDRLSGQLLSLSGSDLSGAALSGALRCCHVDGWLQRSYWLEASGGGKSVSKMLSFDGNLTKCLSGDMIVR